MQNVKIRLAPGAKMPRRASDGAAGLDLYANIDAYAYLHAGGSLRFPTGVFIELPRGLEAQVRSRSGLAFNQRIEAFQGTIDADYRGEIVVLLSNYGRGLFIVEPGMRIAQLVIAPVWMGTLELVSELTPTERGEGGFGSTGVT